MTNITWSGSLLNTGEISIDVGATIDSVMLLGSIFVVSLNSDDPGRMKERFQNIRGYDGGGNLLWESELPSDHPADAYWSVTLGNPIRAMSFSSFECLIDPANGKLIRKEFYK